MTDKDIVFLKPLLPQAKLDEMFGVIYGFTKTGDYLFKAKNMKDAYMWQDAHTPIEYKSATEDEKLLLQKFILERDDAFHTASFLAWHDYCGYWELFKPSLDDVINLLYAWWENKGKPRPIIVQTLFYPSNDVAACFDSKRGRHRGRTTVWWPKNKDDCVKMEITSPDKTGIVREKSDCPRDAIPMHENP